MGLQEIGILVAISIAANIVSLIIWVCFIRWALRINHIVDQLEENNRILRSTNSILLQSFHENAKSERRVLEKLDEKSKDILNAKA